MSKNSSSIIYVIVVAVVILCLSVAFRSFQQEPHDHRHFDASKYDESKSVEPVGTAAFVPKRHQESVVLDESPTLQKRHLLVSSSSSSEPLEGVLVLVISRDGKDLGSHTTSESGLVTLSDSGYPNVIARLSHPTHLPDSIEVEFTEQRSDKTINISLDLGGFIRGRIAKVDGRCPEGTVVTASLMSLGVNEKKQWTKTVRRIESISTTPNKEGYFAFGGLPLDSSFSLSFEVPKTYSVLPDNRYHVAIPNGPPIELMIASLYACKIELIDSATESTINIPFNTKITFESASFHNRFVWLNPMRMNSNTVNLSKMFRLGLERSWQYFCDGKGGRLEPFRLTAEVEVRGYEHSSAELLISPISQVPFLAQQLRLTRKPQFKLVRLRLPIEHVWPEHKVIRVRVRRIRQYNQSLEYFSMIFENGVSAPIPLTKGDYILEYGSWQQSQPFYFDGETNIQQIQGLDKGVDLSIEQPVLKNKKKAQYFVIRTFKSTSSSINTPGPFDDLPVVGAFKPVVFQSLPTGSYRMTVELPQSEQELVYEWEITKKALKSSKFMVGKEHLK